MTRLGILNTVTLNAGDAAILEALRQALVAALGPATRCLVFDRHPEAAARVLGLGDLHPEPHAVFGARTTPRRQLGLLGLLAGLRGPRILLRLDREQRALIEALDSCDVLVSTGGTYLTPPYRLEPRLFHFELAHALGKRLILATQSIGRYPGRAERAALGASLNRARCILLRDFRSLANLEALGVSAPEREVRPDLAFGLARPERLAAGARRCWPNAPRIALSVRDLDGFSPAGAGPTRERYARAFIELATHLVEVHGAELCFVSTCQGVPEYSRDDSKVAEQIVAALPAHVAARTELDRGFQPPWQLLDRLASFDAVVATRMHMAILALCAGTPALPVAYEFKTAELFEGLGLSSWVSRAQHLEPDTLVRRFERMLVQLPEERAQLMATVARYRDEALPLALLARVCSTESALAAAAAAGAATAADAASC